jgi:signal peptidase II
MSAGGGTAATAATARRTRRWIIFGALAGGIVLADQITKRWVDANFQLAYLSTPIPGLAAPTSVIGDLVRIAKSYNDGGLFGLFGTAAPMLALASLFVIAIIVWFQWRAAISGPLLMTITLGLLLGGAVGNLLDRLRLGYVIDYVDTGLGTNRWFTFNVADAAISLAIVGLIAMTFLGDRLEADAAPPVAADAPGATDG